MKKLWLGILIVVLALTGCATKNDSSKTSESDEKVLTIAQGTDMTTFDPQNAFNTHTDTIISNVFSHLYRRTPDNEIVPDLATDYENIDDHTWRFKLRDGIKFHNGDPLTAEDVKYTFERVATDESLSVHSYYRPIKEVKVIDPLTFDVITSEPTPTLLALTAFSGSWILPKNYIEENGWEHFLKNPIGSGPYQFVDWVKDDRVTLEPFADYYEGKVEEWDKVVFRAIPEASTRVNELLTGGVDLVVDVPPNEWDRIDAHDGTSMVYGDTSRVMILLLRLTEGFPTADPKVREAIDLAIDDKMLAETILGGAGVPTRTRITPGIFGSQEKLYDQYLYDPEKAKTLLKEAGYGDGLELTLQAPRGRYLQDAELAEALASMLGEVGITVKLEISEWSNFINIYQSNENKDLLMIALGDSLGDASDSLLHYTIERAKGQTDYVNEETDRLFFEAGKNMNVEEREGQYQRIQDVVAEERPHIPIYLMKGVYGVSDRIEFTPYFKEQITLKDVKRK